MSKKATPTKTASAKTSAKAISAKSSSAKASATEKALSAKAAAAKANSAAAEAATNAVKPLDLSKLFREHRNHLLRFVQRYVRNPEDAEDVVQNTFLEAMRCADRFSGLSKPSTWLFGIALNLSHNQVRRNCANICDMLDDAMLEEIIDFNSDPAMLAELRQIAIKVEAMLAAMPAEIRTTFEAVLEGESTYEEAAARLKIPVGTVRSRVSRVRATVRSECA